MTDEGSGRLSRTGVLWTAILVLALGTIAVWRWVTFGAPTGGDWAQYMSHALAIVEGRPYGDIGYLYTPDMWFVGPPAFPPGTALTVAPVLAVFGPFSQAPLVVMHIFLLVFLFCAGKYFARQGGPAMGWSVAGLLGAAFLLSDRANVVGSDLGMCAFVWACILLSDKSGRWTDDSGRWTWGRAGWISILGVAALLYRVTAAPLVPALALTALFQRKTLGLRALFPLLVWLPALWFVLRYFGIGEAPLEMMAESAESSGVGEDPAAELLASLGWIVRTLPIKAAVYQQSLSDAFLYPFPSSLANRSYHVLAFAVMVVGLWDWIRSRPTALAATFAVVTVAMLTVTPQFSNRYLWVLTPFLCYGLLQGLVIVPAWLESRRKGRKVELRRPLVILPFSCVLVLLAATRTAIETPEVYPEETEAWQAVDRELAQLESQGAVRVASNRPRKVTWFTGVPAMPIVVGELDLFLSEAEKRDVTHIVVTTALKAPEGLGYWDAWVRAHPELFVLRAHLGSIRIYDLTGYDLR